jgi:tungstate transport system ATP-binding protein
MVDGEALSQAVLTTFVTSGSATLIATLIGVPLGAWCARQSGAGFAKLKTVVTALYGLPPVVVGVFVYALLSKSGVFGSLDLLFTVQAMVIAQTCLILPLVWGGSWTAFDAVGQRYADTLSTLGISQRHRFETEVRLASNGVYHAIVIAFGRAVAEVGAVIMVGGNIAGKTRVMTTSIVLETSKGNMDLAGVLGVLLLLFSLLLVAVAAAVQNRARIREIVLEGEALPTPPAFPQERSAVVHVTKGDKAILSGVEVGLRPGTITVVVGESGAGKTTLLRALAGLEGDDVVCGPRECVFVQQQPVTLASSVGEELSLTRRWFPALEPSALAYARLFGLDTMVNQRADALSGGERQRLVLARQLALAPSLLLLDECTASLGWMHVQAIEKELLRLKSLGVCMVLSTHNMAQARRLADTLLVLHEGVVLDNEDPLARSMLNESWSDVA